MKRLKLALTSLIVLAAILLVTGCEIEINTVLNEDGSGSTITRMIVGTDIMEKLRSAPNSESFSNSWMAAMKAEGTDTVVVDDQVTIRRDFQSPEEFSSSRSADQASWSQLGKVILSDGEHMYFLATFDTNTVYKVKTAGQDESARQELEKQLDESKINYSLEMPGELLSTNSPTGLSWNLPMRQSTFLFAESRVTATEELKPAFRDKATPVWIDAIRITGGVGMGIMIFAMSAYPWRRRNSV
ncbi:MAG: hypothetical protein ACYC0L_10080 [Thermoleophilia bacterium]